MLACASPLNQCEAIPTNQRKFRHLDCGFAGCPANQRKRHSRISGRSESCPISAHYRTLSKQDKRGGLGAEDDDKAPPWVMLRPWSDSIPPTHSTTKSPPPNRAARRRSPCRGGARRLAAPRFAPVNPLLQQAFPSWARPPNEPPSAPTRASRRLSSPAPASLCWINFFASIRRSPARCASAWPSAPRPPAPAWRASRGFFRAARRRTSRAGRGAKPAPPGVCIGCGAVSRRAPRGSTRRRCDRRRASRTFGRRRARGAGRGSAGPDDRAESPLAAAAGASAAAMNCLATRRASTPRFSRSG